MVTTRNDTMKKIGVMTVSDDFVPNMQDAYAADFECGNHNMANKASELYNHHYPTIVAMAALIEDERDGLRARNGQLREALERVLEQLEDTGTVNQLEYAKARAALAEAEAK